jgi:hypothetical protein
VSDYGQHRPSRRPKVGDVKTWDTIFHESDVVTWRGNRNSVKVENGYPFPDFYRVTYIVDGVKKSKLFYGESAWSQVNRLVSDLGVRDWWL